MEKENNYIPETAKWKQQLFRIIFKSDTKLGKLFDLFLLILILFSTLIIMLESMKTVDAKFHKILVFFEIIISVFFTIEYSLRIITIKNKNL